MPTREEIRAERIAASRAAAAARRAAILEERRVKREAILAARLAARENQAAALERLQILATVPETPGLPRVLLIGDSISMGYTLRVRELLEEANVQRIPNNGGTTAQILAKLDEWLSTGGSDQWDVIHFNSGVHDAVRNDDPPEVSDVSLADYATNLQLIVDRLKAHSTHVVFATTTPNPPDLPRYGDHVAYNNVAVPIMEANGVLIDDLYAAIQPYFAQYGHGVHYLDPGYEILATAVAAFIDPLL